MLKMAMNITISPKTLALAKYPLNGIFFTFIGYSFKVAGN